MNRLLLTFICLAAAWGVGAAPAESKRAATAPWEPCIVSIEVARKAYDYLQPWATRTRRLQKTGVVAGEREILTTADELFDRTLVRLQKEGRGKWWMGEVTWIDYHANLALLTVKEPEFWKGLKPVRFGSGIPADGNLQIMRWRDGNLENRRAEFKQCTVREGQLSSVNHAMIDTDSDILGAGWGEPLTADSRLLGLITFQQGRACTALPASFIRSILEARKQGRYHGLGYFPFYWQPAENPASLAQLGLPGDPRGGLVISVPPNPQGSPAVLRTNDVLLSIDGVDVDIHGDYDDPEFGRLLLENLATRDKWAGDSLKLRVWRDRKELQVDYPLPRFDYTNSLVPMAAFDREPEYLIVGGLVFQPLIDPYLQSWGPEWKRRAPFRLLYYRDEPATREQPSLLVLAQVLPDSYNIGYQEQRYLVLDTVNGRRVSNLRELNDALQHPEGQYHILEFARSDTLRKVVLAAGDAERQATARVLERYGIDAAARFDGQQP